MGRLILIKINISLTPIKTMITLFTTRAKDVKSNLGIVVNGAQILTAITHKLQIRNRVLKVLAPNTCGMDEKTLSARYNTKLTRLTRIFNMNVSSEALVSDGLALFRDRCKFSWCNRLWFVRGWKVLKICELHLASPYLS